MLFADRSNEGSSDRSHRCRSQRRGYMISGGTTVQRKWKAARACPAAMAALLGIMAAAPALAALERGDCTVEKQADVPVEMRDGTILMANIYRPEGDGSYPVLLQRLPYDKTAAQTYVYADPEGIPAARRMWHRSSPTTKPRWKTVPTCWSIQRRRSQRTWRSLVPSKLCSSRSRRHPTPISRQSSSTSIRTERLTTFRTASSEQARVKSSTGACRLNPVSSTSTGSYSSRP